MPKQEMTLIQAVNKIDVEHYRHLKASPAAVKRLYLVAEDIGEDLPLSKVNAPVIDKAIALPELIL